MGREVGEKLITLSVAGTALSILFAWWTVQVLKSAMPEGVPRVANIAVDLRVLATAASLSLITGFLAGIVPALQLSKPDLTQSLKESARAASAGRGRQLEANDPRAFAAAVGSLSLAALIASIIPARRAASVDPVVALRAE